MPDYATGWVGVSHPTIELPDPQLDITGPFLLFEWDEYEAGGGLRDFTGSFATLAEVKRARHQTDATIAIYENGTLRVVLEHVQEFSHSAQAWLRGWRVPK